MSSSPFFCPSDPSSPYDPVNNPMVPCAQPAGAQVTIATPISATISRCPDGSVTQPGGFCTTFGNAGPGGIPAPPGFHINPPNPPIGMPIPAPRPPRFPAPRGPWPRRIHPAACDPSKQVCPAGTQPLHSTNPIDQAIAWRGGGRGRGRAIPGMGFQPVTRPAPIIIVDGRGGPGLWGSDRPGRISRSSKTGGHAFDHWGSKRSGSQAMAIVPSTGAALTSTSNATAVPVSVAPASSGLSLSSITSQWWFLPAVVVGGYFLFVKKR